MNARSRSTLGLALALGSAACIHVDSTHNAPGKTDITDRPTRPDQREPESPGENMILLAAGPFGGLGADLRGPGTSGTSALGAEVSAFVASTKQPHQDDLFFTPRTAYGFNLGATVFGANPRGGRPLYAEAAVRLNSAFGVGLGWQTDAGDGVHGPQLTLSGGPLYVRFAHQFGNATFLTVGLVLKGQMAFVWSK